MKYAFSYRVTEQIILTTDQSVVKWHPSEISSGGKIWYVSFMFRTLSMSNEWKYDKYTYERKTRYLSDNRTNLRISFFHNTTSIMFSIVKTHFDGHRSTVKEVHMILLSFFILN